MANETAKITAVASSASNVSILASNRSRRGLILCNTDANGVYIKFGTTATTSDFSLYLAQNGIYTMTGQIYTGAIDAIWAGDGTGYLVASEL